VFDLTVRGDSDIHVDIIMADFLRDNNLSAGKSDVFTDFENIRRYYAQAGIANNLRPKVKQFDHLCMFRDVVKQYLLENCTETLPAPMVCAPELLLLKTYDEEHQTEFYRTLSVFLKNDLHSVRAAKELFVARSTFIYRLERIQAITGLDFAKLTDKWYLLLSLELLEQADGDKQDAIRRTV
jgi:sugar diacid utilization regulator